jgi:tRNA(Ile)-lysidine synthetase-like protein
VHVGRSHAKTWIGRGKQGDSILVSVERATVEAEIPGGMLPRALKYFDVCTPVTTSGISARMNGASVGHIRAARFRYDVAVLDCLEETLRKHRLVCAGQRIGVAVSGGADSVALLRALAELAPRLGVVLLVLHLNHKLRGSESEGDAAFVGELAARLSLEAVIESENVAADAARLHLSLEAAGRRARYGFFQSAAASHRLDCIATAHTLDDQAETVLLRLLRGAGTSGLAGIHRGFDLWELSQAAPSQTEAAGSEDASKQSPRLIRPLLSVTRRQVEEYLGSLGQEFREDASNLDARFLRNRVRHELLPGLERDYNPQLRQALAETAEIAAAEDAYLEERVSSLLGSVGSEAGTESGVESGVALKLLQAQPLALQRRMLRRLCRHYGLALDFAQMEALREFSLGGRAGRINLPRGFAAEMVREKIEGLRLCLLAPRAMPAATYSFEVKVPGTLRLEGLWNGTDMYIRAALLDGALAARRYNGASFLSPARAGLNLTIRNLCPGDRFHPLHTSGERKLNRLLQELSIPAALRRRWPVALTGGRIVWVPGLPVASHAAWTPGEGEAVVLELHNGEGTLVYG